MDVSISLLVWSLLLAWLTLRIYNLFYNIFLHPLRDYPGPLGARSTTWWKTYIEVVKKESFVHLVMKLHEQYGMAQASCQSQFSNLKCNLLPAGDVVRVSPNEVGSRYT
jgi:hypothetical protein